jgi:hypothetical protein
MIDLNSISTKPVITPTTHQLTLSDHWDHLLARVGYKRSQHRVKPGLYSIGDPQSDSPVFVSANYTLSFDALRSQLEGIDCHILVLDTYGVNVWCAAGKKTFGTDELVIRINATQLKKVVDRYVLILPQLGAPGISAHEVKKRTGFKVQYGPVRASDLPEYLRTNQATPEMRKVIFSLRDRMVLIPVDFKHTFLPAILLSIAAWFLLGGLLPALAVLAILFSASILFPILLPWLPSKNFSTKGFLLGFLTAVPFILVSLFGNTGTSMIHQASRVLAYLLVIPPPVAYIGLNFTGATTFTSKSGVRREMFRYLPVMAWTFGAGVLAMIASIFIE